MASNMSQSKPAAVDLRVWKWPIAVVVLLIVGSVATALRSQWWPSAERLIAAVTDVDRSKPDGAKQDEHDHGKEGHDHDHDDGHDHSHKGHDEASSLELSSQARANIGLKTGKVKLTTFVRRLTMPAMVISRPGLSSVEVTALLGGRVMRLYAIEGEAVEPGDPLFDLRLTHEELVQAQSDFLRTAEELDVVAREIHRLQSVQVPGAIPGKTVREREYEQQKLNAVFNAQRQSLLLHGLTEEQVNSILKTRRLLQSITVVAPMHVMTDTGTASAHPFSVRRLEVKLGQYVDAGAPLCELVDYSQLYVQGRAFEHEANELLRAARQAWPISATREDSKRKPEAVDGLKIAYVENEVEPDSRALYFYVGLPNEIVHQKEFSPGRHFLSWRYKPGQQMELHVPVEQWEGRIVVPVDAVAKDGIETYVFQENGDHFDRIPVHVEYRDRFYVVIANDGSIKPGTTIAISGAHQLQMALKNKAGGGADPHAGHNH